MSPRQPVDAGRELLVYQRLGNSFSAGDIRTGAIAEQDILSGGLGRVHGNSVKAEGVVDAIGRFSPRALETLP
jgi:hypothetical protein